MNYNIFKILVACISFLTDITIRAEQRILNFVKTVYSLSFISYKKEWQTEFFKKIKRELYRLHIFYYFDVYNSKALQLKGRHKNVAAYAHIFVNKGEFKFYN